MSRKNFVFRYLFLINIVFWIGWHGVLTAKPSKIREPKLVAVLVVDQFAYHYITKLRPFFRYGLKTFFDKGVVYTNAYHAHSVPETTPGHHAISTGTLPKDHGAPFNQWIGPNYQKIRYDNDDSPNARIFKKDGVYDKGKSSEKTMVDGLSDQFVLYSKPKEDHKVFSFALKSYPSIAMANRLGKAVWFDDKEGGFTSSKKYFSELPGWIRSFNKKNKLKTLKKFSWNPAHSLGSACYDFFNINNYEFAAYSFKMVSNKSLLIDRSKAKTASSGTYSKSDPYSLFMRAPISGKHLIDLAKICVDRNFNKPHDRMLLWVSLSNLDLLGHMYGPDCMEIIDMIYHIDKQLQSFMDFARRRLGEKNCLFVLVADHGIAPIPELMKKQGVSFARRIMAKPLIKKMNDFIESKYQLKNVVKVFEPNYFVFNKELMATLDEDMKATVVCDLKKFLERVPGIQDVWTYDELKKLYFESGQRERFCKDQLYKGRAADLFCVTQPYCLLTHYPTGTSHSSPYEYDLHVPLVLYQKGSVEKKVVEEKVWVPQLPVTLAHILNIPRPSAARYDVLPAFEDVGR